MLLLLTPALVNAAKDETQWNHLLKKQYFADKTIKESNDIIEIEAPYRAEDPALVPIKIISKLKQTKDRYIKKIIKTYRKKTITYSYTFIFSKIICYIFSIIAKPIANFRSIKIT